MNSELESPMIVVNRSELIQCHLHSYMKSDVGRKPEAVRETQRALRPGLVVTSPLAPTLTTFGPRLEGDPKFDWHSNRPFDVIYPYAPLDRMYAANSPYASSKPNKTPTAGPRTTDPKVASRRVSFQRRQPVLDAPFPLSRRDHVLGYELDNATFEDYQQWKHDHEGVVCGRRKIPVKGATAASIALAAVVTFGPGGAAAAGVEVGKADSKAKAD